MFSRLVSSVKRNSLSLSRQVSFRLARYVHKPIAIVGLSRGGTTHLAELINDRSCNICWEPLTNSDYQSNYKQLFLHEIGDPPFIPYDAHNSPAFAYFSCVFNGKTSLPAYVATTPQRIGAKGLIIKFCRGGGMLPYFAHQHDIALIHLVRSPFAVIASQLRFSGYREMDVISDTTSYIHGRYSAHLLERWGPLIRSVRSKEEMFAIWWCLNHAASLAEDPKGRWLNLFYEDLHLSEPKALNKLYQFCVSQGASCASPDDMAGRLGHCSATVKADSPLILTGKYDQFSWINELNHDQIKNIADTVSSFGLENLMINRWLPKAEFTS